MAHIGIGRRLLAWTMIQLLLAAQLSMAHLGAATVNTPASPPQAANETGWSYNSATGVYTVNDGASIVVARAGGEYGARGA
jgi:hypothetical protein